MRAYLMAAAAAPDRSRALPCPPLRRAPRGGLQRFNQGEETESAGGESGVWGEERVKKQGRGVQNG